MAAMGETTRAMIAGLDAPTASIVGAIIGGFVLLAARWAPKTRTEAAVDRSQVGVNDAQRWRDLFDAQEKTIERQDAQLAAFRGELDEVHNALEEERRECDRQITELSEQVLRLTQAIPPPRLFFRE